MTAYWSSLDKIRNAEKVTKGPAYTRYVNRVIGRYFAAGAYQLGLSPNQVSMISFAFSLSGIAAIGLIVPSPASGIAASVLLAIGYALDSADGQVARLGGTSSPLGEWLDHILDCAKISLFHLSVLIALYRFFELPSDAMLLIPMTFLIVDSVTFFGGILTDQIKRAQRAHLSVLPRPPAVRNRTKSLLMLPVDYGVLLWVPVLLFNDALFVWAYATLLVAHALFLAAYVKVWTKEIRLGPDEYTDAGTES